MDIRINILEMFRKAERQDGDPGTLKKTERFFVAESPTHEQVRRAGLDILDTTLDLFDNLGLESDR